MSIRILFASTAALALIAGTPAVAGKNHGAQAAGSAQASGGGGAKAKEARKTCRTFHATGSHSKVERLCLTKEGWRKFEESQR